MSNRFMRVVVLFDLPVKKKRDRKIYSDFRKFLLRDGYDMIQFSVYARVCNGLDNVEKHLKRLNCQIPKRGSVRSMVVTDRQYAEMVIHVGKKTSSERKVSSDQLLIF